MTKQKKKKFNIDAYKFSPKSAILEIILKTKITQYNIASSILKERA